LLFAADCHGEILCSLIVGLRQWATVPRRGGRALSLCHSMAVLSVQAGAVPDRAGAPETELRRAGRVEEVIAFVIGDDERGEVLDLDAPNCFHPELLHVEDLD